MKTFITIAAGLLTTFAVSAAQLETVHRDTMLTSDSFGTKSEALNAGFNMYESLNTASNRQLRSKLTTFADNVVGGISVESAQVRIEEVPVSRNKIEYRAVVDVDYNYKARRSND
ncbi:acyl-CoA synthetase [Vibrio albus]|uniref:Acyl-CoA synthetase n=1 Tax=Vibrio albus TaxID=2200953 RepID=A0A2U3B8Z7_9VIBR|nr:DUF3316 domain-containing protein [Vibrio albus]PWI33279.1 acyl-CoA synthetase [Vibrio albus]